MIKIHIVVFYSIYFLFPSATHSPPRQAETFPTPWVTLPARGDTRVPDANWVKNTVYYSVWERLSHLIELLSLQVQSARHQREDKNLLGPLTGSVPARSKCRLVASSSVWHMWTGDNCLILWGKVFRSLGVTFLRWFVYNLVSLKIPDPLYLYRLGKSKQMKLFLCAVILVVYWM